MKWWERTIETTPRNIAIMGFIILMICILFGFIGYELTERELIPYPGLFVRITFVIGVIILFLSISYEIKRRRKHTKSTQNQIDFCSGESLNLLFLFY